jgi:hypothetical protein
VTNFIASGGKIAYAMGMASSLRCRVRLPSPLAILLIGGAAAAGCSDGDDPAPDAPVGPCAQGEIFFTGELLDWDSTSERPRGVNAATFTAVGEATRTDQTAPNGRFELCLANAATTQVTVDATAASTYLDGVAVAERAVLATGTIPSLRSFTALREMQFAPRVALGKAQVLVDVAGAQRAVTLPVAYEAAFAFDGATWAAGTTGRAVFFVNVDASAAARTTKVTMPGSFVGGETVPLTANQLTFVTVVGQ